MSVSEARFTINIKEGIVELEGKETFVDRHLEKFEEIFKSAVREAINRSLERGDVTRLDGPSVHQLPPVAENTPEPEIPVLRTDKQVHSARHAQRAPVNIPPIPVDLKAGEGKPGLREIYAEKRPANHYEKVVLFVYYLTKLNKQDEAKFGELLSCYEEVNEKKPSILDIVKNSIRYKGWLEQGSEKFSTRLSISGENHVKFDMPLKGIQQRSLTA